MATLGVFMSLLSPFDVVIWITMARHSGIPPEGKAARNQQAIYAAGLERHNLNLRQRLARLGQSLSFSKSVELHDKVIGHYLNIKHYQ